VIVGRFSNLEFDGREPLREEPQGTGEIRDEHYYLRQADQEFRRARFEKALRFYSRALEYNANVYPAWVGQVQMLIELGEYKEAKLWADKALEVHRDNPDILSAKVVACARTGERDKAIEFSDAAIAQKGTTPFVWLARGEALMSARQANDEYCLEKAAAESKQDWFMQLRIARVFYSHRQFARAMTWITKATKQEPGAPFVLHVLGDCQAALGFSSSARSSYRQALALDPEFALASAGLDALDERSFLGWLWSLVSGLFRWR
jgi:tetratricopeptide (TPR) repeat protein